MPIIRKCLFCGKEFRVTPYIIKKGWGKYCSHSCSAKYRHREKPEAGKNSRGWRGGKKYKNICKGCGKKFGVLKCHIGVKKYCTSKCRRDTRITPLRDAIRGCSKYFKWRSNVFQRDNWTCQTCGQRGCVLQAHHIKPFSETLKQNAIKTLGEALSCNKLWNVDDGVTLCIGCHKLTDNYGWKSKNIKEKTCTTQN